MHPPSSSLTKGSHSLLCNVFVPLDPSCLRILVFLVLLPVLAGSPTSMTESITPNGTLVKLFTYHRDEVELLADWAAYHIRLVGADNIYIIDQNSSMAAVEDTLMVLQLAGVHIVRLSADVASQWVQGESLSRVMREAVAKEGPVKLLVPLDVDEFIVGVKEQSGTDMSPFSVDPDVIRHAFETLPESDMHYLFKFEGYHAALCNDFDISGGHDSVAGLRRAVQAKHISGQVPAGCYSKSFFPSNGFEETWNGNHYGVRKRTKSQPECKGPAHPQFTCPSECFTRTNLAVVHYGDRECLTYDSYVRKFTLHATMFGYKARLDAQPDLGMRVCDGSGVHHCTAYVHWLQNATEFRERFYRHRRHICRERQFNPTVALAILTPQSHWLS